MSNTRGSSGSRTHRHDPLLSDTAPAPRAISKLALATTQIRANLASTPSSCSSTTLYSTRSIRAATSLHSSRFPASCLVSTSSTSSVSPHNLKSILRSISTSATTRKRQKGTLFSSAQQTSPPINPSAQHNIKEPALLTTKQKAYLAQFPPQSDRWAEWISALTTLPGLTSTNAENILYAQPLLLTKPHLDVPLHLSGLASLLSLAAGIPEDDFPRLLCSAPLLATYNPGKAAAALAWLIPALQLKPVDVERIVREQPGLLAFGVDTLSERMQAYLDLDIPVEDVQTALIAQPFLLTLAPKATTECLNYLCQEFGCDPLYVLQNAPGALRVNAERHRARAAFLNLLEPPERNVEALMTGASDASFAAVHIRGYQLRTGRSLLQLCDIMRELGGGAMKDVLDDAEDTKLLSNLKCFQIFITWEKRAGQASS